MGNIWEDVKSNYPITKTPERLALALKEGKKKKGVFIQGRYFNRFHIIRQDKSAWVVSSEKGGKYVAGGNYYVSKKNPKLSVWD